MGYKLNDRIEVSLFIDRKEYPLHAINVLNWLKLDCMVGTILPTCHFSLTDVSGLLSKMAWIQDATSIVWTIKASGADTKVYPFRVFNFKPIPANGGTVWEIDGYWDRPRYWSRCAVDTLTGTSVDVLSRIALGCGMEYYGVGGSADSQTWYPGNMTYGEWVREIVKRGFRTEESFMCQGVDFSNTLYYMDFNEDDEQVFHLAYGQNSPGNIPVADYRPNSSSGFNNRVGGYRAVRREQQPMEGPTRVDGQSAHDNVVVQAGEGDRPLINTAVRNDMERGYQYYSPINFGNVHDSYERATYQNMRYANLYAMSVAFMITEPTPVTLFDYFNFVSRQGDEIQEASYSGLYRTTAKNITIQGPNYVELIEGTRHGLNLRTARSKGPQF